jgi:hypothetical protein
MLDGQANKAMNEVLQHGPALIEPLDLTPIETGDSMQESQRIITQVTEAYFDDQQLKGRKVGPVAGAAAMAFSLTYFDKWIAEIERRFPGLGT